MADLRDLLADGAIRPAGDLDTAALARAARRRRRRQTVVVLLVVLAVAGPGIAWGIGQTRGQTIGFVEQPAPPEPTSAEVSPAEEAPPDTAAPRNPPDPAAPPDSGDPPWDRRGAVGEQPCEANQPGVWMLVVLRCGHGLAADYGYGPPERPVAHDAGVREVMGVFLDPDPARSSTDATGYASPLAGGEAALLDARVEGEIAVVDLDPRAIEVDRPDLALHALVRTLMRAPAASDPEGIEGIAGVEVRLDGDADAFCTAVGLAAGCAPLTRDDLPPVDGPPACAEWLPVNRAIGIAGADGSGLSMSVERDGDTLLWSRINHGDGPLAVHAWPQGFSVWNASTGSWEGVPMEISADEVIVAQGETLGPVPVPVAAGAQMEPGRCYALSDGAIRPQSPPVIDASLVFTWR